MFWKACKFFWRTSYIDNDPLSQSFFQVNPCTYARASSCEAEAVEYIGSCHPHILLIGQLVSKFLDCPTRLGQKRVWQKLFGDIWARAYVESYIIVNIARKFMPVEQHGRKCFCWRKSVVHDM